MISKVGKTFPASALAAMLAVLSIAVLFQAAPARADYTATINPATTWGTWQGWGTSLCWEGNVAGNQANQTQLLYATSATTINANGRNVTLPGLGMNIVRYNLGGCSSGTLANGQTMNAPNIGAAQYMQGFETTPGVWNWNADANQRQMLANAKADGADYFEMFSNSPMWWMTNNYNPSGAAGGGDNLNMSYANSFANYIATTAQYFKNNYGITFNAVEPFNEPMGTWWNSNTDSQEGCHVDPSEQATVIGLLRTQLNNAGLTGTAIAASDENSTSQAVSTWNSFSNTTQSQVGWVQTHGYGFNATAASQLYSAAQGKQLWDSEYGENDTSGLRMAEDINQNFTYLHSTAWCYWLPIEGANWGLINGDVSAGTMGTVNPKYYVLAQYSRSIREGMTILSSGDPNTVAAYDPVNHDLWLVTTNTTSGTEAVTYNLGNFSSATGPVTGWCTLCNGGSNYQQFSGPAISGGNLSLSFAASSVQTLEIQGVYLTNSLSGGTWNVSGGSAAWSSAANWSPNTVPGVYTTVTFTGGGGTCVVNAAGCTSNSLSFSNSAPFALASSGGNGLTVQSGITVGGSSNVSISVPTLTLAAASTCTVAPGATLTVSGSVSGSYALTETGGGMLVLEAVNTYLTGPVIVSSGTLYTANTKNSGNEVLGNAQSITINNGGVIQVDGTLGAGYNSLVGGGHSHANIYINKGGLLASTVASPASNNLGELVLDGGTVSAVGTNGAYGTWNLDGGVSTPGDIGATSYILGGNLLLTEHANVNGGSATVFNVARGDTLVIGSTITSKVADTSSPDNLLLTGGGTLILSGSNNFSSGTYVENGKLIAMSAAVLPAGSSLFVGADAASIFALVQTADSPVNAVPEPSTIALLIAAAIAIAVGRMRSRTERCRVRDEG